jgi:hypothetical protein
VGSEAPCGASERLQRAYRRTGSERMIKRKERVTRCAGQPAFSVARTVYSSVRAGLVSGSVIGSCGFGARTGSVEPVGGFWTARVL